MHYITSENFLYTQKDSVNRVLNFYSIPQARRKSLRDLYDHKANK